jgi:predicted RNase H-like nuclease (RuvC/YqgF family)
MVENLQGQIEDYEEETMNLQNQIYEMKQSTQTPLSTTSKSPPTSDEVTNLKKRLKKEE